MGVTGKCNFEPLEWQLRNIQPNGYSGPAEQLSSTGDGIQPISSGEQQKLHQPNKVNSKQFEELVNIISFIFAKMANQTTINHHLQVLVMRLGMASTLVPTVTQGF